MVPFERAARTRAARGRHGEELGEPVALLSAVLAEHGDALSAFTRRLSASSSDAEDLLQEVLLRAWRHPEALDGSKGSARCWLFSVARNLAVDAWRRSGRRPGTVAELDDERAGPQGLQAVAVADLAERVVDEAMVSVALGQLSEQHREVLVHTVWLDHPAAQVAADLGIPLGTVKSRVHYALVALRLALEEIGYRG